MTVTVEEVGKYLGKTIADAMGRPAGKIVGLTADIKDEVKAIQVAQNDGEVNQYAINFVKIIDGRPIIMPTWRVEAEDLRKEHDIVKRRSQALDLLIKDGDIDQIEYNQQRNGYEDMIKEIKGKRETLLDSLKQVEVKLEQQIRDLQAALTNNKMLYTASEIDQQTYQAVTESVRSGLEIARKEHKELEDIREYLQKIDDIEATETQEARITTPSTKVPDVVVIKMRDPEQI